MIVAPLAQDGPARADLSDADYAFANFIDQALAPPTTRLGRPSWISAEQHERLGPWKPIRKAADRRVVGIVVQGYRNPVVQAQHGQHWRTRDAVRARIALERIDGFALLAVDKYAGDTLARRLKTERSIRWICCLVRGDLARPIPGAWAKTATEALELVPDRWELRGGAL